MLCVQSDEPDKRNLEDPLDKVYLKGDQIKFLKSQIDKYFLVSYDCSKPQDVSAVSSFIDDPCEQTHEEQEEVGVEQTNFYLSDVTIFRQKNS